MHQQRPGVSECPESYARWYCLNGATCFAVEIRNTTLYNCWCPIGFQGLRCDYKYPEHRNDADSEVSTSIELVGQEIDNQASSNQLIVADSQDPLKQAQHHDEIYLILMYNLITLPLLVILIFLLLRLFKLLQSRWDSSRLRREETTDISGAAQMASSSSNSRLGLFEGTIGCPVLASADSVPSEEIGKTTWRWEKNGQINHDSILVGLDMITQQEQTDTGDSNQIHRSPSQPDETRITREQVHPHGLEVGLKNEMPLEAQQQFAFSLLSADYNPTIYLARNYKAYN